MSDLGIWMAAIPGRQMATWRDTEWAAIIIGAAAVLIFGGAAVRRWLNRGRDDRN